MVLGIINVTPDSFSDGGQLPNTEAAIAHAMQLLADGADILDIGGESTRPGAQPVEAEEELRRVLPVIEGVLRHAPEAIVSIDTMKPAVARAALRAGAAIINDVSGARDPDMVKLLGSTDCGYILMHMQGEPRTMQQAPHYADVVAEVGEFFEERIDALAAAGVARGRIVLDPGIGFGKALEHNVALLRASEVFGRWLGLPVLIGASRKRMIGELSGFPSPSERDLPSAFLHLAAVARGAALLRVHDVALTRMALRMGEPLLRTTLSNVSRK